MGHYAKVLDGVVVSVIVAEQEFFATFVDSIPGQWIQTSYNTRGGVHLLDGTPLRKNFAGISYKYDEVNDAFVPPRPYTSWIINGATFLWDPPTPYPETGDWMWDEDAVSWVELT